MTNNRFFACVLLALILTGCASIPLGTMWKMYRLGPEGVLNAKPSEVRAAVLSDSWFLDNKNFDEGRLELELRRADDSMESFSYVLESVPGEEYFGLDRPGPDQRWRVYAIKRDDLEAFQSMQSQLVGWLDTEEFKGGSMSIAVKFDRGADGEAGSTELGDDVVDDPGSHPEEVRFRIDLRLIENEGYFTLIREYSMPVNRPDQALDEETS